MDAAFLQARIDACKTQIVSIETAIDGLVAGAILTYELDTGQSKTKVTKAGIPSMLKMIDVLMERCVRYETRLNGGGTIIAGPGY